MNASARIKATRGRPIYDTCVENMSALDGRVLGDGPKLTCCKKAKNWSRRLPKNMYCRQPQCRFPCGHHDRNWLDMDVQAGKSKGAGGDKLCGGTIMLSCATDDMTCDSRLTYLRARSYYQQPGRLEYGGITSFLSRVCGGSSEHSDRLLVDPQPVPISPAGANAGLIC